MLLVLPSYMGLQCDCGRRYSIAVQEHGFRAERRARSPATPEPSDGAKGTGKMPERSRSPPKGKLGKGKGEGEGSSKGKGTGSNPAASVPAAFTRGCWR